MSLVLDETSIRASRPGLRQANGSRSLVWPLRRHGRRIVLEQLQQNITFVCDNVRSKFNIFK